MTTLRYRKIDTRLQGNELTGNTYPIKDFIKSKLDGKWNADHKSWVVNTDKVNYWIKMGAITVHETEITGTTRNSGWCDKCKSYCYGDCTAS